MGNAHVLAFSSRGYALAVTIAKLLGGEAERVSSLNERVGALFQPGNVLVFVGAAGIAVRGIAPHVKSKTTDPAVLVVDERGGFVIPLLSGHIGGANEYALRISAALGATPVITTATDINGLFAVDTYATRHSYHIVNPQAIKHVSAALLEGEPVGLSTPFEIVGALPSGISTSAARVGIYIGSDEEASPFPVTLRLCPKIFHVGIGARKNTDGGMLDDFFIKTVRGQGVPVQAVASVSSIDLKKDEGALVELADKYGIEFITYSAGELEPFSDRFEQSEFVKQTTGVGNVCEAAAYLSSKKGEMLLGKTSRDGMTIAIAKEVWRVSFT